MGVGRRCDVMKGAPVIVCASLLSILTLFSTQVNGDNSNSGNPFTASTPDGLRRRFMVGTLSSGNEASEFIVYAGEPSSGWGPKENVSRLVTFSNYQGASVFYPHAKLTSEDVLVREIKVAVVSPANHESLVKFEVDTLSVWNNKTLSVDTLDPLIVFYDCQPQQNGIAQFAATALLEGNTSVTWTWLKNCSTVMRDDVTVMIGGQGGERAVANSIVSEDYTITEPSKRIEDSVVKFAVQFEKGTQRVLPPSFTQEQSWLLMDPHINLQGHAGVWIRGVSEDAVEFPSEDEVEVSESIYEFFVLFTCKSSGTSKIVVKIPIPPFPAITFAFTKVCPQTVTPKLIVKAINMFAPKSTRDIVQLDVVSNRFDSKSAQFSVDPEVVSVDTAHTTFLIRMSDDSPVRFTPLIATSDGRACKPTVEENTVADLPNARAVLVQYHCIKDGRVTMTLTLARDNAPHVTMNWWKDCRKPLVKKDVTYITAPKAAVLLSFGIAVIVGFVYFIKKRSGPGARGYGRVPAQELQELPQRMDH